MTSSGDLGTPCRSRPSSVTCPQSPMPRALENIAIICVLGSKLALIRMSSLACPAPGGSGKPIALQVPGLLVAEEEDADLVISAMPHCGPQSTTPGARRATMSSGVTLGSRSQSSTPLVIPFGAWSGTPSWSTARRGQDQRRGGRRRDRRGWLGARPRQRGYRVHPALLVVDPQQDRRAAGQRDSRPATCRQRPKFQRSGRCAARRSGRSAARPVSAGAGAGFAAGRGAHRPEPGDRLAVEAQRPGLRRAALSPGSNTMATLGAAAGPARRSIFR